MGPPPPPMFRMPGVPIPPLATALPSYLRPKKKFETDGPMKRANWKAIVPHKMSEKAFWVKCEEEKLASEDILAGLAAKFSSKPIKKADKDSVDKPTTLKKNVVDLRVLDGKTAQNILILIGGSLKHLSHEQIKQSILRCDMSILSSNIIQQLIQYLPPPDQLKRLQEIKATGEELSTAEKFAATLGEVKRLVPRLHSLNFKLNFNDMVQDVKPDIVAGNAACGEVKTSKKFAKILELTLLFGNFMNSGSKNGQAFGFEISFLTKLTNTKDHENKHTLLHYMVETIESKFSDLINFPDELPHVDRAARVSLENIQKTMQQMTTSLKNLKSDLENNKTPQSEDDRFMEIMGEFLKECKEQVDVLVGMKNNMETYYKEVGEYFSFDTNKYPMEEFFSDIKTFKDAFMAAYRENVKIREEEEKSRRIREAREQAQRHLQDRQQRKLGLVDMDSMQPQEGVMDSLLEALQTGSAFGNRDRRKRGQRPAGAERRAQLSRSRSRTRVTNAAFTAAVS